MEKQQISITMPQVHSQKYKIQMKEIEQSVRNLNSFTNNLEQKVGNMLKGQEIEFVKSYKNHMTKIEQALKQYQRKIDDYQKKIEYYENQGVLATFLNKISFLQGHQKKLLTSMAKKDHIILTLKGEIQTQDKEIKSLQEKIKEYFRIGVKITPQQGELHSKESQHPTFSTEVQMQDRTTLVSDRSLERINQSFKQFQTLPNPEDKKATYEREELKRVSRQMDTLKKRNRQLSSVNSKIIDKANSIEQFFLRTINQLKRKVSMRKNFSQCTFEQFKQQDKLQLLVKILSNQQILKHLYHKIFCKMALFEQQQKPVMDSPSQMAEMQTINRSERLVNSNNKFPLINTGRRMI